MLSKKISLSLLVALVISLAVTYYVSKSNIDRYEIEFTYNVNDIQSNSELTILFSDYDLKSVDHVKTFVKSLSTKILRTKNSCASLSRTSSALPILLDYEANVSITLKIISDNLQASKMCKKFLTKEIEKHNQVKKDYFVELAELRQISNASKSGTRIIQGKEVVAEWKQLLEELSIDKKTGASSDIVQIYEDWKNIDEQLGTKTEEKLGLGFILNYMTQKYDGDVLMKNFILNYMTKKHIVNKGYKDINIERLRNFKLLTPGYELVNIVKKPSSYVFFISSFLFTIFTIFLLLAGTSHKYIKKFLTKLNRSIS